MKNELIKNHIIDWLNQYCISSKKDGFVIGISGGIDSALTSTLRALTSKKTICLSMPINQNTNQIERANEHIRFLKKQFKNVVSIDLNLNDSFNHFKTELSKYCSSEISFVNSKSRLRMVSLYCIAQEKNVLVTGTGNKVEDFGIGFYTKYGDGGVDLSPIADLMKSQVKELAEFLNISKNIICTKIKCIVLNKNSMLIITSCINQSTLSRDIQTSRITGYIICKVNRLSCSIHPNKSSSITI